MQTQPNEQRHAEQKEVYRIDFTPSVMGGAVRLVGPLHSLIFVDRRHFTYV